MLIRHPSFLLRSVSMFLALTLPAAGCLVGADEPEGESESASEPDGERLGAAADAVLSCGDGTSAYYPCYHDYDDDGRGAGTAYYACHCGSAAGTSLTHNDCDDGNAARFQLKSCYADADGDDYGTGSTSSVCVGSTCETRVGYATVGGDCNDSNAARFQMKTCYADADGDHYGTGSSSSVCMGASCASPAGYAESSGDCDDTSASRHPFTTEVAENGLDDDCDGAVDDAATVSYSGGNDNTSTSFQIRAKLNGAEEIAAAAAAVASGGTLYARVHYRKLEEGSSSDLSYPSLLLNYVAATVSHVGSSYYVEVTLPGLEAGKVYRAALALYQGSLIIKTRIPNGDGSTASADDNTDTYYTMTRYAPGDDGPVRTARYNIVLNALYERYYFHTHDMGNWNDTLRDRYDLAAADTAYCSEFYANAAKPFLEDLNPCDYDASRPWCDPSQTSHNESSLVEIRDWFIDPRWVGSTPFAYNDGDMTARKPGDWLGINPSSESSLGTHTQMFLAWDATAEKYWYVEGNGSTSFGYGTIRHTVNVGSTDQCDDGGDRFYCPAGASAHCPIISGKACFSVKSTGSINNSNMLD